MLTEPGPDERPRGTVEKSPLGLIGTGIDVARGAIGQGPYAGVGKSSYTNAAGNIVNASWVGSAAAPSSSAVTPLSERLSNNLMGSAITAFLIGKALEGNITRDGRLPTQR